MLYFTFFRNSNGTYTRYRFLFYRDPFEKEGNSLSLYVVLRCGLLPSIASFPFHSPFLPVPRVWKEFITLERKNRLHNRASYP